MQLRIIQTLRKTLYWTVPALMLVAAPAASWAQTSSSGSGQTGSVQSESSQRTSSSQRDSDDDQDSSSTSSSQRRNQSNRDRESDTSSSSRQGTQSSQNRQSSRDDDFSGQSGSSSRSGLGQTGRDRSGDTTQDQRRSSRSSSEEAYGQGDDYDRSQQSQRSRSGLGQSNRDRREDDDSQEQYGRDSTSGQRRSSRSYEDDYQDSRSQGQDRSSSQSSRDLRSRSGSQARSGQFDDQQQYDRQQYGQQQFDRQQSGQQSSGQQQRQQYGQQQRYQYDRQQYSDDRSRQRDDFDSPESRSFSQRDWQSQERSSQGRITNQRQLGLNFSGRSEDELVISNINPQSIAANAGLRSGDEIVSINGRRINSRDQFMQWIQSAPGSRLNLLVRRNGREIPITLAMTDRSGQWNQNQSVARDDFDYSTDSDYTSRASLGVVLDPRYQQGAMIDRVYRGSPAEEAGLQRGDYIVAIDGQRVSSPQELVRIVGQLDPGSQVEIEFTRRERQALEVTLGSQGGRQDGSFSLTQERRSSSQRTGSRGQDQFQNQLEEDEYRD